MHEYVKKEAATRKSDALHDSGRHAKPWTRINQVPGLASWGWLKQAVLDIHACRYQSLLYGVFFVLMGLGIEHAHAGNRAFALGLSLAFMFAGPFLSIGLYELSRQIQSGERVDLVLSLFSWCRNPSAVGRFALYLSIVMVLWLWLSSVLLSATNQTPGALFFGVLLVWAGLAVVVFMASAVAIPMMLDRPVSAMQAVRCSLQCFRANTRAMGLWAIIVACVVGFSLALGYWPLLLAGPVLGHATWHAYRAILAHDNGNEPAGSSNV